MPGEASKPKNANDGNVQCEKVRGKSLLGGKWKLQKRKNKTEVV